MAAAALCHLKGGTPEQCAAAAAMALGNLLGLVCDPVAGLVEVPCIKRNVVGAVNAVSCANMALAGWITPSPAMKSSMPWAAWAVCSPLICGRPARAALPQRRPVSASPSVWQRKPEVRTENIEKTKRRTFLCGKIKNENKIKKSAKNC